METMRERLRWWWFDCWLRRQWDKHWNHFANRWWRKWNVIRIKTLSEQWCDRDEVLLHAMFQILVDFVEGENPRILTEDTSPIESSDQWEHQAIESQRAADKELRDLYVWWTEVYPKRHDPLENLESPDPKNLIFRSDESTKEYWESEAGKKFSATCDESRRLDDLWYAEEEEMMARLIKLRKYLWT